MAYRPGADRSGSGPRRATRLVDLRRGVWSVPRLPLRSGRRPTAFRGRSPPDVLLPGGASLGTGPHRADPEPDGRSGGPQQQRLSGPALAGAASGPTNVRGSGVASQGGSGVVARQGGMVGGDALANLGE